MSGLQTIRTQRRNKYTVAEMACYMGVSAPTYHKWEIDPKSMTIGQARKLADYLQCSVDDLFSLEKDTK